MQRERDSVEVPALLSTAAEYRRKGYDVVTDAAVGFVPGARADLIATKQGDNRVIEVKTRSALRANPSTEMLACAVEAEPGWSFDLVLVPEPEILDAPSDAAPLDEVGIRQRLGEAALLLDASQDEAAFLLAWSACEAAIVHLLIEEDDTYEASVAPASRLLTEATMHGAISREENSTLRSLGKLRNAIVHGFRHGQGDLSSGARTLIGLGTAFVSAERQACE